MTIKSYVQEPEWIYYSSFLCLSLSTLYVCSFFLQIYYLFFHFSSLPPLCFPNWILCQKSPSPQCLFWQVYCLVLENLGFASYQVACISKERRAVLLFPFTVFNSCIKKSPYFLNSVSLLTAEHQDHKLWFEMMMWVQGKEGVTELSELSSIPLFQ